ncbi:MAG TPA: heme ABC transporter permease [Alphaproteobacteria bacterium]|nr:heme ABC transporter permease [Alphaproteobacteria bacterium]
MSIQRFANPTRFLRLSRAVQPWVAGVTVVSAVVGLYLGLFVAPPDYQQGESVRIMYVHVPASWAALFSYVGMAAAAAVGLIWKHPLADMAAKATAPIGAAFTFLALVTGSLWGKPMWGTYWVWDARLTSMLVLLFLYLGYMALAEAFDDPARGVKASSILVLAGVINVPIIKFSVDWWNTLHQTSSVFKRGGPSIDPSMLWPLFLMALSFTTYYVWVLLMRIRAEIIGRKIRALRMRQTRAGFKGAKAG